ncbi:GntR family transcriptional regulator [Frondihabitans sucicola]|uniref:GntR family transcriptional regulator n=1 Tax=Frondihabitans sucicola TaxID=1268041 RepID=A0ABM8GLY0_9MICO|nr:GntR family transcriptional regulator [Frondihabitans sucicola]BDZ49406.1 GntR family transcriptional regulator [Frondihabitans sucicola]
MSFVTRNVPLSTQIIDLLRARIDDGTYPIGSRLPSELELANALDVSRNSVREALRALVHSGLLSARAGDGTYVRASSELVPAVNRRIHAAEWADVLDARSMLDRHGARAAARTATEADVSALRELLAARDLSSSAQEAVDTDTAFHLGVIRAGGNALLVDIYSGLEGIPAWIASVTPPDGDHPPTKLGSREPEALRRLHADLVDAIAAHDEDDADRVATALLAEAMRLEPVAPAQGARGAE